jgi:hypothetical protein
MQNSVSADSDFASRYDTTSFASSRATESPSRLFFKVRIVAPPRRVRDIRRYPSGSQSGSSSGSAGSSIV